LACLLLSACQSSSPTESMTKSGYKYTFYTDAAGDVAQAGQYVYYEFDILSHTDSLLQSYRNNPNKPISKIPANDAEESQRNPIVDVLSMASVGDSIGVFLPKDSIPSMPPQFSHIPYVEYRLAVTDILNEEEYQARVTKEREEAQVIAQGLQAKEADIAALVKSTIDQYNAGSILKDLIVVEGELKYFLHEEGSGPVADIGNTVLAQYYGCNMDGSEFDNSFKRGRGYPFTIGQGGVIKGWDLGFRGLKEGTKATLFVPSELAYGEMGSPPNIGPNADLAFYIEVEKVSK